MIFWVEKRSDIPIILPAPKSTNKEKVKNGGINITLGVWIRVTCLEAWFQTWKDLGGQCPGFCTQVKVEQIYTVPFLTLEPWQDVAG